MIFCWVLVESLRVWNWNVVVFATLWACWEHIYGQIPQAFGLSSSGFRYLEVSKDRDVLRNANAENDRHCHNITLPYICSRHVSASITA